MNIRHFNPDTLAKPYGYTHSVAVSGKTLVYCAGEVSVDRSGQVVGRGDYAIQAYQAMSNVVIAMRAAGADTRSIVKFTMYVVDLRGEGVQKEIFRGLAKASREQSIAPAPSAMIGVDTLMYADLLIEIEAVAIKD